MAEVENSADDTTGWATVLVPPTLVRALDRYIAEEAPRMSRPQAMCRALQDWFTEIGYLPCNCIDTEADRSRCNLDVTPVSPEEPLYG
jgi:hypothetical protein